jgi:hypothetical protein
MRKVKFSFYQCATCFSYRLGYNNQTYHGGEIEGLEREREGVKE